MEITLIIVGGMVLLTIIGGAIDYMGKRAKAADPRLARKVQELEKRLELLDAAVSEKDERIGRLETEVSFVNKLLEDRSPR